MELFEDWDFMLLFRSRKDVVKEVFILFRTERVFTFSVTTYLKMIISKSFLTIKHRIILKILGIIMVHFLGNGT